MYRFINFFKKPLESASDEITTKFKTPFFSTFIIVWIISNNLFLYNLFFNSKITDKTAILNKQFNFGEGDFYLRILSLIGITLIVMLLYYGFINLSRIITMISEENLKINLLAALKSKTIASIEDINFWKKRTEELNEEKNKLLNDLSLLRSGNEMTKQDLIRKEKHVLDYQQELKNLKTNINKELEDSSLSNQKVIENGKDVKIRNLQNSINKHFNRIENVAKPPTFLNV
jgi:hypothetical protein